MGARWEFARRFAEGIGKLARNTPGDHRMKTVRLIARDSGGCRNAGGGGQVYRIDGGDRLIRHGRPTLSLGKVSYRAPYTYYPHIATDASEEQIARTRTVTFGKTLLGTHSPVTLASDQPNKTTPF
ncbi:hypothetical protein BHE74_00031605 [Ensete ventricosum]|nr:hypothetical protein BHE74_00031605 [Ensete ventricosum]